MREVDTVQAWGAQTSTPPISKYFGEIFSPSHIKLTNSSPRTGSPSVPHPPQFNTSVPHRRATPFQPQNPSVPHQKPLSSTHPPQFHSKNPSVQHTPLSSTPKTPQFNTKNPSVPSRSVPLQKPLSSTPKKPSVPHQKRVTVKLAY